MGYYFPTSAVLGLPAVMSAGTCCAVVRTVTDQTSLPHELQAVITHLQKYGCTYLSLKLAWQHFFCNMLLIYDCILEGSFACQLLI